MMASLASERTGIASRHGGAGLTAIEDDMSTAHEDETASTEQSTANLRFNPPRRRRKPLLVVSAVTVAVVIYLVYLMARGPDAERTAEGLVAGALAALPDGPLVAADVRAAAEDLERASQLHPTGAAAGAAITSLRGRLAQQVETDILQGNLERAGEVLAEARAWWPEGSPFVDAGPLRLALANALERRRLTAEVAELLAEVDERLARDPTGVEATREAMAVLRRVFELDPDNARARSVQDHIRGDVLTVIRDALQSGEIDRAGGLLDAVGSYLRDDSELARARREIDRHLAERSTALEVQRLLNLAERRLAADRLTTPPGDNAVAHYRAVLGLDPDNPTARLGFERVADRYGVLVRDAMEQGALGRAERLLGNLAAVSPAHPDLELLGDRLDAARRAPATPAAASRPTNPATPAGDTAEGPTEDMPSDAEGRLWFEVRTSCVDAELRRYIEAYPAGRYIEEAWRRISSCLEAR